MNDLQNSLLESMSILAKSASQATPATLTIEAAVLECIDVGSGLYLVEYLGNKFKAYSDIASKYAIGELVYVIIPNGDFTKNKIILRAVTPTSKNYINDNSNKTYYNNTTDNMLIIDNEIQLSSYKNEIVELSKDENESIKNSLSQLQIKLKKYYESGIRDFRLGMSVKTNIIGQSNGNYGIILEIPITGDTSRQIILDTSDILGNPLALNSWTPQSKVFSLDNLDFTKEIKLYAFVEGFIENSELIEQYDIYFKDFNFYGIEIMFNIADTVNYELSLTATNGSLFIDETDKTLLPKLLINNQEVTIEGFDCYWFEEDALITISSKDYLAEGGIGWKCVNKKISTSVDSLGKKNIQYNLKEYFYTIPFVEFDNTIYSRRYKCVINYNGVFISKIIEIKNKDYAPFYMKLYSPTKSTAFTKDSYINLICELTQYSNPPESNNLVYIWHRYDAQGNFIEKDFVEYIYQDVSTTEIRFSSNKVDLLNTIRCFIYKMNSENQLILLGSEAINVTIAGEQDYFAIVTPNNILYKYDLDGDSPLLLEYDSENKIKAIEALQVRIYRKDGVELTEEQYDVADITWKLENDSMYVPSIDSVYEDVLITEYKGQTFPYSIVPSFNKEKSKKKLSVDIVFNNVKMTIEPNIQFFKENESTLNGSKYTALIYYNDNVYDSSAIKPNHNLIILSTNNNNYFLDKDEELSLFGATNNQPQLQLKVFKEGKLLTLDNEQSLYSVEWEMFNFNSSFLSIDRTGKLSINDIKSNYAVARAKVTINETSETNSQEVIYAYYPIDIIKCPLDDIKIFPILKGGFNFVTYTKDGVTPKYDTTKNFELSCLYGNEEKRGDIFKEYVWDSSPVLTFENNTNSPNQKITPIGRLDQNCDGAYVSVQAKVKEDISSSPENPEPPYPEEEKNKYEENKNYIAELLNTSYDFYKNQWLGTINQYEKLLSYREQCLLALERIEVILNNLEVFKVDVKSKKDAVIAKRTALLNFNEEQGYDYKLENIIYSKEDYEFDSSSVRVLKKNFNREIELYNLSCQELDAYTRDEKNKNALNAYAAAKDYSQIEDIQTPNNYELLDYSEVIKNNIISVFKGIIYQTNATSLNSYFNTLIPILNSYGKLENNAWVLNNSVNNWFNDNIKSIEEQYFNEHKEWELNSIYKDIEGTSFTIYKPIVFLYDRNELSTVAGWDGSKLYATGSTDEYLTSIKAAVGTSSQAQAQTYNLKEGENNAEPAFSGIALGTHVKVIDKEETREQGIYGYHNGQQTFMLNATNGIASFGVEGNGQIILDPSNDAIIKSGNYSTEEGTGMQINLTEPSISFGSKKFNVDSKGVITATDVNITGEIHATSGSFEGKVTATSGTFKGEITATSGQFGNLKIATDENENPYITVIVNGEPLPFMDADATINFAKKGLVYTSQNSNIGGWNVKEIDLQQYLEGTQFLLDPEKGIYNNNGFYLKNNSLNIPNIIQIDGDISTTNSIIGWTLNSNNLKWYNSSDEASIIIGSNGINISGKNLIDNNGNFNLPNLTLGENNIKLGSVETIDFSVTENFKFNIKNKEMLKGTIDNGTEKITLGPNNEISIFANTLQVSDTTNSIKVGKYLSFTDELSTISRKDKNLITLTDDNIELNINDTKMTIQKDNIVLNDIITIKKEVSADDPNTKIASVVIAADETVVNAPVKAAARVTAKEFAIGEYILTEADFIKLKALLQQ